MQGQEIRNIDIMAWGRSGGWPGQLTETTGGRLLRCHNG